VAWHRPESAPRSGDRLFALLAFLLSAAHFATFFDPERSIVTDVRYFLYFAWQISEGAVPHLDLFDNKTFLASFVGAFFYQLGTWLGIGQIHVIRAGCLAIAAIGGALAFSVFRRLSGGSQVAGFLGLLAVLGFGFLGALPAIGNFPKLIMSAAAPAMALLVHDRRWFLAGATGALAFMDWQIGGLVWLAAFAGALLHGLPRRRAALHAVAGGAAGLAPFIAFYALHGALGVTFRQAIVASFYRGSWALSGTTLASRIERIGSAVERVCPGHEWLFLMGLAGLPLVALLLWRWRASDAARLLLPLGVYHYGVVGFSLVDFQQLPDFFVLLHSVVFFLGATWVFLYVELQRRIAGAAGSVGLRKRAFAACTLLLAVAASRPVTLRPHIGVFTPHVWEGVTLSEQRFVADRLRESVGSGKLVLLGASELLFLMRYSNPHPLIYFNAAAHSFYAKPQETLAETRARVLAAMNPDAFIVDPRIELTEALESGYSPTMVAWPYPVVLYTRN
jgi:hypothetical protein